MPYGEINLFTVYSMGISAVIAFSLPLIAFAFWKIKRNANLKPVFIGVLIFVVFALCLEPVCHQFFVYRASSLQKFVTGNIAVYIIYAGLVAGIFEETGRFLAFKWLMRNESDIDSAVSYGIGHGGIEAMLVVGMTMISNFVMILVAQTMGIEAFLSHFSGETALSMEAALRNLYTIEPHIFLLSGAERISAFALQIALSVLVFTAAKRAGKWYLFPLAIIIHAGVDALAVTYSIGIIDQILIIEVSVFAIAALTAFFAYYLIKNEQSNYEEPIEDTVIFEESAEAEKTPVMK